MTKKHTTIAYTKQEILETQAGDAWILADMVRSGRARHSEHLIRWIDALNAEITSVAFDGYPMDKIIFITPPQQDPHLAGIMRIVEL